MMDKTVSNVNGPDIKLRSFLDGLLLDNAVSAALLDPDTKEVKVKKVGRNEKCPCGSGEKFKKCCLWKVNCGVEIVT
jgi:hypothetical protein